MKLKSVASVLVVTLVAISCGGGGSGESGSSIVQPGTVGSISGTVPGTVIEAFGDNGSYYRSESIDDGTSRHPFKIGLPSGIGFRLVMITKQGTPDQVVSPIGFRDSTGQEHIRLVLGPGDNIDLGHIPLAIGRNAAASDDLDENGVLDSPLILDDAGANNPLSQSDADGDGMDDWDDPDHGGYQYDMQTIDPQDNDDDGIPNSYDDDFQAQSNDSDGDGLPDSVDANPHNERDHANDELNDDCDHDGYNDDDGNQDGFHDDDLDHDGSHDSDNGHESSDNSGSCVPASTTPAPSQPVPTAPSNPEGQALYTSFCAGCHGTNGKRGKSAAAISSAIAGNRGGMGSLSSLTATEVQAIANYLAQ